MKSKGFTLVETKNCRKYTKHIYLLEQTIDQDLLHLLSVLGEIDITTFSQIVEGSHDLFKIRSYAYSCEVSGPIGGRELILTMQKLDQSVINMLEGSLIEWYNNRLSDSVR